MDTDETQMKTSVDASLGRANEFDQRADSLGFGATAPLASGPPSGSSGPQPLPATVDGQAEPAQPGTVVVKTEKTEKDTTKTNSYL